MVAGNTMQASFVLEAIFTLCAVALNITRLKNSASEEQKRLCAEAILLIHHLNFVQTMARFKSGAEAKHSALQRKNAKMIL